MSEHNANIFENGLDERAKAYLLETTRWTKLLAILGMIFNGFMLILAFIYIFLGASASSETAGVTTYISMGAGLFMLLIVALYIFPIVSLVKFSSKLKSGIRSGNTELITEAFGHQKALYKFVCIFLIAVIILYLMIFVIVLFSNGADIIRLLS